MRRSCTQLCNHCTLYTLCGTHGSTGAYSVLYCASHSRVVSVTMLHLFLPCAAARFRSNTLVQQSAAINILPRMINQYLTWRRTYISDYSPTCAQVALCCSVPAHWLLLKSRLEKICPRSQGAQALWRWTSRTSEPLLHPFLLQVTSYNREGVLHGTQAL